MPDWKAEALRRLSNTLKGHDELAEELAQHLEERFADVVSGGRTAAEAEEEVLKELSELAGSRRIRKERWRRNPPRLAGPLWWNGIGGDFRHGIRALAQSRGTTFVALLTLALGIGGNAAIFSVVDAVLLRPLPFEAPDRLAAFWGSAPEKGLPVVNYPGALYSYFRTRSHVVHPIAAYTSAGFTLTGPSGAERLNGTVVTAGFFELLGRPPMLGRGFLPEEEARGRNHVVVLSHGLWLRRFGGDVQIVGKTLTLDDTPTTVVGVMPKDFDYPYRSELWAPIATDTQSVNCWCYSTIGRLPPGRTPKEAARDIALLSDAFWRDREPAAKRGPEPRGEPKSRVVAVPLATTLVGEVRTPLLLLLGAVGLVLLIACANVANLLLARATARSREIAVRTCLGAGPWRVVRQLLVESLLLGLGGGLLGVGVALAGVRAAEELVTDIVPGLHSIGVDLVVLGFTFLVVLASVALFGLAPAIRGAHVDLQGTLKDGSRTTRGPGRRLNDAFVVVQLSLSLVLLAGAGLLLRSFDNLMAVDPGFRADNVLVGRVVLPSASYQDQARARTFYQEVAQRVRALPGVVSAAFSSSAPFSEGDNGQNFVIRGREPRPGEPTLVAAIRSVTAGYFRAIGTSLRLGRAFEESDAEKAPLVAIVDETLAHRYWPDGNALGNEVRLGDGPWRRIVGVAASVRYRDLSVDPYRFIYLPNAQAPSQEMDLVVRTGGTPAALAEAVRREVGSVDAAVPFYEVHTLTGAVTRSLGARRLTNGLLLAFALGALLLAASGIYGTMALSVGQRVNEFGIRQTLGAARRDILALVLGRGMRLIAVGVALGLAGALGAGRAIKALLFHVTPLDPFTLAVVALLLGAVALLACYLPALRATRVDPLEALRCE